MKAQFLGRPGELGVVTPYAGVEMIANEPMLFSASIEFARQGGGPLTQEALDAVERLYTPEQGRWPVIDTRVHMLMPGMVPAIPGWHCDAVPRPQSEGQPEPALSRGVTDHWTVTIASPGLEGARTEFLRESVEVSYEAARVWGSVHEAVEEVDPETLHAPHGVVMAFSDRHLHRATKATTKGWRFFFRLSRYHSRPRNLIRKQVQVYMPEAVGW